MAHYIKAVGDTLTFYCQTLNPTTAAETDADSDPTYKIYEEETGTAIATGTMSKLDDAGTTGFYSEQVTLASGTGYERLKDYIVRISATVSAVTGSMYHTMQMSRITDEELGILERGTAVSVGTNSLRGKVGTIGAGAGNGLYLTGACTTAASRYKSAEIATYTSGTETYTVDPNWPGGTPAGTIDYWILQSVPALSNDPVDADLTESSITRILNKAISDGTGSAGTVGKALTDAATAATDPLTNTAASYSGSQLGAVIGNQTTTLAQVKAKTDLVTGDGRGNILAHVTEVASSGPLVGDGASTPIS